MITSIPVVAASVLCIYSIKNSPIGTNPAGQRGQSGQERPTPEALTYPPKKIRVNRQERVPKERYCSEFIFSRYFQITQHVRVYRTVKWIISGCKIGCLYLCSSACIYNACVKLTSRFRIFWSRTTCSCVRNCVLI